VDQGQSKAKQVKRSVAIFWVVIVAIVSFIAGTRSNELRPYLSFLTGVKTTNDTIDLSRTQEVYQLLKANFDGSLDTDALVDGASRGMVAAAGDPHTTFFSKNEKEQFEKDLHGEISGIGAEIGVRGGQPTILRVIDTSPAKSAGLAARDVIVRVGDTSVEGADAASTAKLIRGEANTTVKVVVKRGGETKEFSITRAVVTDSSVEAHVEDGVGMLRVRRFDGETADLARRAGAMFVDQHVRSVIVDLRDNGGGQLDQVASILGMWLDNKTVLIEKRGGVENDRITSKGMPILSGIKTVVLINGGTASASEIVIGALKDYKAATLIGERSYGKGTVQQTIDSANGTMLKVTIEHWFTPNGATIDKTGVEPDKKVELTSKDIDADKDPQMDAAKASL
jgi:carboxyl-terminal processing protease